MGLRALDDLARHPLRIDQHVQRPRDQADAGAKRVPSKACSWCEPASTSGLRRERSASTWVLCAAWSAEASDSHTVTRPRSASFEWSWYPSMNPGCCAKESASSVSNSLTPESCPGLGCISETRTYDIAFPCLSGGKIPGHSKHSAAFPRRNGTEVPRSP